MQISVRFGKGECFEAEVASQRVVGVCLGPRGEALADPGGALACQLDQPLDFPPLGQCVVPGDRVAVALDQTLPQPEVLVEPIVERLLRARVQPADITLVSPASSVASGAATGDSGDPRGALPPPLRERVRWESAGAGPDPLRYLANTASGHRIYLNRRVVDADVVLPVGCLRRDPLVGCRSPSSAVYPALSDEPTRQRLSKLALAAAQARAAAPHREHPLAQVCQETDEVAWLLGIQFTVAVVPGQDEQIAHVLAGDARSVVELGRRRLADTWTFALPRRSELVVAGLSGGNGAHGPEAMAAALEAARRVVKRGGMIVLLSQVTGGAGPALRSVAAAHEPRRVLRRLGEEPPPDALSAQRIARAVSWAQVYLLSRLDQQLVEDLSMVPIGSLSEAGRLVARAESVVVLNDAHQVVTSLQDEDEA